MASQFTKTMIIQMTYKNIHFSYCLMNYSVIILTIASKKDILPEIFNNGNEAFFSGDK
jgi:hypothetical protein